MISYELVDLIDQYTDEVTGAIVKRFNLDGSVSCIPLDPANSDYQAYLNKDNPDWNNQPTL